MKQHRHCQCHRLTALISQVDVTVEIRTPLSTFFLGPAYRYATGCNAAATVRTGAIPLTLAQVHRRYQEHSHRGHTPPKDFDFSPLMSVRT